MKQLLTITAFLTAVAHCVAQVDVDNLLAESKPAIQEQLRVIRGVFRPSEHISDNIEALREIQKLKELTDDEAELVEQVAIFAMAPGEEMQPLTAAVILHYLQIPSRVTIRTLAPHLDATNPELRSFVRDWFQGHDNADAGEWGAVNYKDYLDYVRGSVNRGEELPAPFIKYIYERSPERALMVFAKGTANVSGHLEAIRMNFEAHQQGRALTEEEREQIRQIQAKRKIEGRARRQILLAEHIVSNAIWLHKNGYIVRFQKALPEAKEALAMLAENGDWWARLYVAHIMRRNPALRQEHIMRQLAEDGEPLVREAAGLQGR
jgi:hypothetical protein